MLKTPSFKQTNKQKAAAAAAFFTVKLRKMLIKLLII